MKGFDVQKSFELNGLITNLICEFNDKNEDLENIDSYAIITLAAVLNTIIEDNIENSKLVDGATRQLIDTVRESIDASAARH